jgi:uncharacterized membrane protein
MTDTVAVALIAGGFGALTTAITTVGTIISRKTQKAAQAAAAQAKTAVVKVEEVHDQAKENWQMSHANYEKLEAVQKQTDGNVKKLQEAWAEEARRRETAAWQAAFEAGRRAEMTKSRRATDALAVAPATVNDDEPKE